MSLRKRKNKRYNEETNDEEDEGGRKFSILEQIRSKRFDQDKERHLQELTGDSITLNLIQRNGFEKPIFVEEPAGLDLHVPPRNFLVRDVRDYVGHDRIIDVMDVRTQKNIEMSMKDWCKYYESKHRDKLLNVISLEFSHTKLDELVEAPKIVRLLDWVDLVWPKFLKESQTESTNSIDKMKYPKVQKYCLMSVKGSYTDFHIDFGGTSVWYHIIKGKKIFWMVPPTELNLQTFEEWTLSGMQQDVFFGDTVEECFRVELVAGNTFFIPSGWIHAVYTLEDSLVFGGNFLHSFGIENQLRVSRIEDATKVPVKFRYPFYTEILWYVVQHYVQCLTGKDHLHRPEPSVLNALESTAKVKGAKKTCIKNRDDDDGTTESDHSESDSKKKTAKQPAKRKKRVNQSNKPVKKKSQKPATDDDDSTEIDSAYEDDTKQTERRTCTSSGRMTKNSLLRVESEIAEQDYQRILQLSLEESKKEQKKIKTESPSKHDINSDSVRDQKSSQGKATSSTTSSPQITNDTTASHESPLLNGWSANSLTQNRWSNPDIEPKEPLRIHITRTEINGLRALVKHLSKLSGAKKNLPALIRNSRVLLDDCRKMIAEHENDDPELAITGKPITIELLNPKKTNINDLIDQFFKPTQTTESDSSLNNSTHTLSLKSDSVTLTQQQRLKLNLSIDDKKPATSNVSTQNDASPKTSPQKETKCLSPNKKSASLVPSSSSISSPTLTPTTPTPRPKSPPTRPLSNNQYTSSRTKQTTSNTNQLLLPGSFADLIAATSTEKKVFEVSSAEVTSSIFGLKDPKPAKINPVRPIPAKDKSSPLPAGPSKPAASDQEAHSTQHHSHHSEQPNRPTPTPHSPEPSKVNPQKRFINPAFRPQVKEKLIFASAPYVSPLHASDQSRTGGLYPWQSPAVPPPQHSNSSSQQQAQRTSVSGASDTPSAQHNYKSTDPDSHSLHNELNHNSNRVSPQKDGNPNQISQTSQAVSVIQPKPTEQPGPSNLKSTVTGKEASASVKNDQPANLVPLISHTNSGVKVEVPKTAEKLNSQVLSAGKSSQTDSSSSKNPDRVTTAVNGNDQPPKKPAKPRGPPKKSKEARQALDTTEDVPKTVICTTAKTVPPTASASSKVAGKSEKSKTKLPKKKDTATSSATNPVTIAQSQSPTIQPQIRQQLICGLVAPTLNTPAGTKISPQQYLISRPLMYNRLPTLSAAQFQSIPRVPMPLLSTATISSSPGFPAMQQGARIVWATQPPKTAVPTTGVTGRVAQTTTVASAQMPKFGLIPTSQFATNLSTSVTQPDNAALLSLATTALSTAPMPSNPTLSHVGIRQPATQAIMVSSANQPTLLSGQQLYSSLMAQRMPVTQFLGQRPTVPRPTGQLVFARLPNQGQPRYLITPPGFMAQRSEAPLLASQPGSTLAFASYPGPVRLPVVQNPTKPMKSKKVKTH